MPSKEDLGHLTNAELTVVYRHKYLYCDEKNKILFIFYKRNKFYCQKKED